MPENWKKYNLGDLSEDISYGYTESASKDEIGPKFLRITDIQNDFIDWNAVPYCKISEKDLIKYQVEIGDIVVARTGNSTGATSMIKDNINAVYASYLIRYRLDKTIAVPEFIDFVLRSNNWKNYVDAIKGGSAQPGANAKQFAAFEINLPPLEEQKSIASILSALDDKIELNLQMNKTLEEMASALYKHWFVDFGPFQEGKFVESELGMIPEGWEVKELKDLIVLNPRLSLPKGAEAPFVEMKALPIDVMSVSEIAIKEFKGGTKFQNGDILFARITPCLENGKTAYVDFLQDKEVAFGSTEFLVMRAKPGISKYCIYCLARDTNFRNFSISTMVGTSGRQRVQNDPFLSYELVTPPFNIFDLFTENVEPWFLQIRQNTLENQTLTSLRDTLLPKLISGEVRVKEAEKILTDAL